MFYRKKRLMTEEWTNIITPKTKWYKINISEIWEYRDLIMIFVKRDIISIYKQTILGPIWFLLGPLFTVFVYTFLFSGIAKIPTEGLPGPLFYLSGTTLWNYFQQSFNSTSSTFVSNSGIFGKVYFPRLVSPISLMISNLFKFFIQMITFVVFLIIYNVNGHSIYPNSSLILLPIVLFILGGIAFGGGIIISSLTTKYRDLNQLVGVMITLLMYATPIMYPVSTIPQIYKPYLKFNPVSPLVEIFRFSMTGSSSYEFTSGLLPSELVSGLLYSFVFMIITVLVGVILFNKTEKSFMDTV